VVRALIWILVNRLGRVLEYSLDLDAIFRDLCRYLVARMFMEAMAHQYFFSPAS